MNKKLVSFLSSFIPSRCARIRFRNQMMLNALNRTNTIRIAPDTLGRCKLSVSGNGNRITIGSLQPGKGLLDIRIIGDNNTVQIADRVTVSATLLVVLGGPGFNHGPITNSRIIIGEKTGIESLKTFIYTSNSAIEIGSDCMISYDVTLYHSDGHPVYDYETGKLINRVNTLSVGNHVWIGWGATLLKNVKIPDDCIIGWGSVVTGTFTRSHCAICGNPAACVTPPDRKITWARRDPDYTRNSSSEDSPRDPEIRPVKG